MKSQWFGRSAAIGQYPTPPNFSVVGVLAFMLAAIALVMVAAILGASVAVGLWPVAVVLVGGVFAVAFYAILWDRSAPGLRDAFFWIMLALVFVTTTIHKFTGYSAYYLLELSLVFLAPLLLKTLAQLLAESRFFRLWFAGLAVFFLLSLLSSVFGRSHILAAGFQFVTNLKVIFVLLLGFYIAWSRRTEEMFWWVVRWLWLPMILLVAWQWGHPSSYFGLMGHADPGTKDSLQLFPSRGLGPFQHSSYLGLYSGVFAIVCLLRAASGGARGYFVLAFCYLLLLVASTQRQEMVAAVIVSVAAVSLLHGRRFALRSLIAGTILILVAGAGAWILIEDNLLREAMRWGFIGHSAIEQPRQVLYMHAVEIANQYFPLGSGLGTFAGAGAQKFDISLHLDRGFARYFWFYKANVLVDTYWTNFLAETGWFTTLWLILLMVSLVGFAAHHSLKAYPTQMRQYWLMAFGGMFFMFILSLTSPSFQDPGLFLVPGIFLGVAYNRTVAHRKLEERG